MGDFGDLPSFKETNFVRATSDLSGDPGHRPDVGGIFLYAGLLLVPIPRWHRLPGFGVGPYAVPISETQRNIPEDTIPLKEGTRVVASDREHVGNLDHLFLKGDSNKVTHFLISRGILFQDRKLVPAHWVKSVEEDTAYLVASSELLDACPLTRNRGCSVIFYK